MEAAGAISRSPTRRNRWPGPALIVVAIALFAAGECLERHGLACGKEAVGRSEIAPNAESQVLAEFQALPLAVHEGKCECIVPTFQPDDKFYLIVGSLSTKTGPFRVHLETARADGPTALALERPEAQEAWKKRIRQLHQDWEKAKGPSQNDSAVIRKTSPPQKRMFYLFAKEHDFNNPENYVGVSGVLRGVGEHCQVYVDRDYPDVAGLQAAVDDAIRILDTEVCPRASKEQGQVVDVDRDGRFTILFTPWLGKLVSGKVSLGGFVHGTDFYQDLPAPFGNRCDMMYLNANLRPGPFLHTLLAHEYAHAVVFSEHVFGQKSGAEDGVGQDEEGWLNEGLAHLAEDRHGYSWANLDYRISAFLSAPERYQLVVPDYYGAGLWRSHGNRGAAFLFLRWCSDRFGPDFAARLIRSKWTGIRNVEVASEEPFADLFRQWTAALVLDGTNSARPSRFSLHRPLGDRLLCGPRMRHLSLAEGDRELRLAGTAAAFFMLHSPASRFSRITITADEAANLQVTLIRLPKETPRLGLSVLPLQKTPGKVKLKLTAKDAGVTLQAAAWERLVPADNRTEDTSFRAGSADRVSAWFADPHLEAGQTRKSKVISLADGSAPTDSRLFKIAATDKNGHLVAAWAIWNPPDQHQKQDDLPSQPSGWLRKIDH